MNTIALESFITSCDEYMIAEEGFKERDKTFGKKYVIGMQSHFDRWGAIFASLVELIKKCLRRIALIPANVSANLKIGKEHKELYDKAVNVLYGTRIFNVDSLIGEFANSPIVEIDPDGILDKVNALKKTTKEDKYIEFKLADHEANLSELENTLISTNFKNVNRKMNTRIYVHALDDKKRRDEVMKALEGAIKHYATIVNRRISLEMKIISLSANIE